MKKILLVIAMLIIAAPVLATVSVTATDKGSGVVEFRYNCSAAEKVRAFALDITVDNGLTISDIRDFNTGESNVPGGGYGIFPGKFANYINASSPNWADTNYTPVARTSDPNTKSGLGTSAITVELGTLYVDGNAPGTSGLLFRLDVNGNGAHDGNLSIALNNTRGGIVLEDASLAPSPVLTGTKLVFLTCTTIPTITGLTKAAADTALTTAGFTPNGTGSATCACTYNTVCSQNTGCVNPGSTVNYSYETGQTITNEVGQIVSNSCTVWTAQGFTCTGTAVVDCNHLGVIISQDTGCKAQGYAVNYTYGVAPPEPVVTGLTRAAAVTALTNAGFVVGTDVNVPGDGVMAVGNVYAQSPVAGTLGCGTTVTLSIVSYPIKDTATTNSFYANWVANNKPACWAYPRQCHGNADGKQQLSLYWVGSNELTILRGAFNKNPVPAGTGICAAFDHKKQLSLYWVGSNDLTLLRAYFNKAASSVPLCGDTSTTADPNFWYWCNPTGGTCPSGQVCAPAGTCPNTP
ncbi:MAG: PASTA domain-containing protein [Sedimentisphaerales bacterium]